MKNDSEIIFYKTSDGKTRLEVKFNGELEENLVCREFRRTGTEGILSY